MIDYKMQGSCLRTRKLNYQFSNYRRLIKKLGIDKLTPRIEEKPHQITSTLPLPFPKAQRHTRCRIGENSSNNIENQCRRLNAIEHAERKRWYTNFVPIGHTASWTLLDALSLALTID